MSPPPFDRSRLAAECRRGRERTAALLPMTALRGAPYSDMLLLKCEHEQPTGSFKVRGAVNRLAALAEDERASGVVAASTGNHGAAVAWAGARLGIAVRVFVPENALGEKKAKIRALGAELVERGDDGLVAEVEAREFARRSGRIYVSPYNDPLVVAGQGTLGLELLDQVPDCAEVFIALGGGGLLAGAAAALKERRPEIHIVGCSPKNSAVMIASLSAGHILELPSLPTLSDGTAGGVEPGAITFPLVQGLMDEAIEVEEPEIRAALAELWRAGYRVEGAAAMAYAAATRKPADPAKSRVVVLCGGNLANSLRDELLTELAASPPSGTNP